MTEQHIISESALRKRLLARIIQHRTGASDRIAADAIYYLLRDADNELTHDLLAPIFEYSDYWPGQLAKQVLGLDEDEEYTCDELLAEFERWELGEPDSEEQTDLLLKEGF